MLQGLGGSPASGRDWPQPPESPREAKSLPFLRLISAPLCVGVSLLSRAQLSLVVTPVVGEADPRTPVFSSTQEASPKSKIAGPTWPSLAWSDTVMPTSG